MTSAERNAREREFFNRKNEARQRSVLARYYDCHAAHRVYFERVIADWSDNGRIDGVYALDCYQAAIDAIPVDLRDYTNAADVISRALTEASRQDPPSGGASARTTDPFDAVPVADTSSASSLPLPLILVVLVAVLVLVAGLASHFARRHRASRPAESTTD